MGKNVNWREKLSPERELVLCGIRANLDEAATGRIREMLRGPMNWSRVVGIAFDHHVETFFHENLKLAGDGLVPAEWLDNLRERARKTAGMSVLLSSELLRIYEIFEKEGVPIIPYKGPVLSGLAYGNLTRRRFVDLDFFAQQKDMPQASALLKSAGFDSKFEIPQEVMGGFGNVPGQYAFSREATRTQVELHTERTLRYFPVPLNFEKMNRRLITVELCGRMVRTFSIEDTLVMLCVHGSKHFWERLLWILDVAQLISVQEVDWKLLRQIAAKLESTRVLLLGLYLAHDLFDAPLPDKLLEEIGRDHAVQELAGKIYEQYANISDPGGGVLPRAVFRIRSRDGVGQGLRHTWRLAMSPTESDRQQVNLPRWLAPLYMLVRPWRLLRQYGSGLKRN
jgi:Uncharacterised nucleotidyltransferase